MSSNRGLANGSNSAQPSSSSSRPPKRPLNDSAEDYDGDPGIGDTNGNDDDDRIRQPAQKKQKKQADGDNKKKASTASWPKPPVLKYQLARRAPNPIASVYPTPAIQSATSRTSSGMSLFGGQMATDLAASWNIDASEHYQTQQYEQDTRADSSKPGKKPISGRLNGLGPDLPPVKNIDSIFDIITRKALDLKFSKAYEPLLKQGLRLVTMCSGTESPVLALKQLSDSLEREGQPSLPVDHLASAEIEPFKQAYIHRNFEPNILFRDVTEFTTQTQYAHTAFGGLALQPANLHMLIAGSSCVDYSSLNNMKKGWKEDPGQSYHTMMGIYNYAARFQPAIVILENVQGAPWPAICEHWHDGGYYPVPMHVDSKDFYIPQTRLRGYLVAFNIKRATEIGLDVEKAARFVRDTVTNLMQRASSPYSDFIYADDDPELKLSKRVLSVAIDKEKGGRDWEACRVRYNGFRVQHSLGNGRPLTLWKNGGRSQTSDYIWPEWAAEQRERILDTLDINYLNSISARHYDMTSKSRILELSQNVDRDQDNRQWGIISCITPSGMPWDTLRGGPLSGREVLALQGIPVNRLSLNEETSRQLQDLAGNAMTSTVVGCVIISAILASHVDLVEAHAIQPQRPQQALKKGAKKADIQGVLSPEQTASSSPTNLSMFKQFEDNSMHDADCTLKKLEELDRTYLDGIEDGLCSGPLRRRQVDFDHATDDISSLKVLAAASAQLCKCDDLLSGSNEQIYCCRLCGHTACNRCAGNPRHKYEDVTNDVLSSRVKPERFIRAITRALPPVLAMDIPHDIESTVAKILRKAHYTNDYQHKPDDLKPKPLNQPDYDRYKTAVLNALHSTLYFQSVKQSSVWRVIYECPEARLELQFLPDVSVETSTTVKYQRNSTRCLWLLYAKPSLEEGSSSVITDLLSRPIARMEPNGRTFLQGSWQFWDPSMPYSEVDIQGLGEPQPTWEQKIGLQKEVFRTLTAFPKLRITHDINSKAKLDSQAGQILSDICGTFELLGDCGTACGYLHHRVSPDPTGALPTYLFLESKPLQDGYLDRMVFADSHFRTPHNVNRPIVAELGKSWRPNSLAFKGLHNVAQNVTCRLVDCWHDNLNMSMTNAVTQQERTTWTRDNLSVSKEECRSSFPMLVLKLPTARIPQNQWIVGKQYTIDLIDRPGAIKDFQYLLKRLNLSVSYPGGEIELQNFDTVCATCAPQAPGLKWSLTQKYAKKKIDAVIRPFEDNEEATKHEKSLRNRPAPVIAKVYAESGHAWLVVLINPTTIVHRLYARLRPVDGYTKATWSFAQSDSSSLVPVFIKPVIGKGSSTQVWPAGDSKYDSKPLSQRPDRFSTRNLWEGQRKALAWMLTVERGIRWCTWDAEILDIPAFDQQFQIEAMTEISVHGAIIADEVGAGKTTTALALIARGLEDFGSANDIPPSSHSGRIRSRATLILVPHNILSQWQREIQACFRNPKPSVVVLKGTNFNQSIGNLASADIILASWGVFGQDKYWKVLSRFCCAPNKPEKAGRAFNQWIEETINDIENIVSFCGTELSLDKFHSHRRDHKADKKKKYTAFSAFAMDKASKEQQTEAVKQLKTGIHNPDAVSDDAELINAEFDRAFSWGAMEPLPALLHLFEFERIIVDEFTYLDAQELVAVQNLKAKYRWMLSGTPPISNPESISSMANLVGARISAETGTKHGFSFKDARSINSNEQSYEEEFREKIQKRNPAWTLKRNARCTLFVDKLVRKNPAPPSIVRKIVEYVVIPQSPLEAYIYNQTFQRITGQPLRFGVANAKEAGLSREEKELTKLQGAKSPEEALLTCHALFIEDYLKDCENTSSKEICDSLAKDAKDLVGKHLSTIRQSLQEAYWQWTEGLAKGDTAEKNAHLITYLECILRGSFGDPTASNLLSWTAAGARKNPVEPAKLAEPIGDEDNEESNGEAPANEDPEEEDSDHEDLKSKKKPAKKVVKGKKPIKKETKGKKKSAKDEPAREEAKEDEPAKEKPTGKKPSSEVEMQRRATDLNNKSLSFTHQIQQLRLLMNVSALLGSGGKMQCEDCTKAVTITKLVLLARCGHVVCNDCLNKHSKSWDIDCCPIEGCMAATKDCSIAAANYTAENNANTPKFGSKMEAVINKIKAIGQKERAVVFVQFDAHRDQLIRALKSHLIKYEDGTKPGAGIDNFQQEKDLGKRVLLLRIESVDSAGWNLQTANHVMFVHPYLSRSQYDYEATMTQAVGRCLRHGQQKDVHVYHFLTKTSQDVNVLQSRTGKKLAKTSEGWYTLADWDDKTALEDLSGPSLDSDGVIGAEVAEA